MTTNPTKLFQERQSNKPSIQTILMPITPVHLTITIGTYYLLSLVFPIDFTLANCLLLASAELIDSIICLLDLSMSSDVIHSKLTSCTSNG